MGKSKGKQATEAANERRRDNEHFFSFSLKIYVLLSAAKSEHIPPWCRLLVRDFCFLCVQMPACQEAETHAKWRRLQTVQRGGTQSLHRAPSQICSCPDNSATVNPAKPILNL